MVGLGAGTLSVGASIPTSATLRSFRARLTIAAPIPGGVTGNTGDFGSPILGSSPGRGTNDAAKPPWARARAENTGSRARRTHGLARAPKTRARARAENTGSRARRKHRGLRRKTVGARIVSARGVSARAHGCSVNAKPGDELTFSGGSEHVDQTNTPWP